MGNSHIPKVDIRILYKTEEFTDFYNALPPLVQAKFDYVFNVIQTVYALPTKFVKRLVNSKLYELRISATGNAYRAVLFAMDHENVIQATRMVLLSGFMKKSNKDYVKQIERADKILSGLKLD